MFLKEVPLMLVTLLAVVAAILTTVSAVPLKKPMEVFPDENNVTSLTLVVRPGRTSTTADDGSVLEMTTRLYSWESGPENASGPTFPGPTIHAVPGGVINLTLVNALGEDTPPPSNMNTMSQLNHTNIHFHGMLSNPVIDDPFIRAAPGYEMTYTLPVLNDEYRGLFWYHTHSGGASYEQLYGGLFGAITTGLPEQLPQLESHILVMSQMHFTGLDNYESVQEQANSSMEFNPILTASNGTDLPLTSNTNTQFMNGQRSPTLTLEEGVPTIIRLVSANSVDTINTTLPPACSFELFALDGAALRQSRPLENFLYVTNGNRYEMIVTCSEPGKHEWTGTVPADAGLSFAPETLMYFNVTPASSSSTSPQVTYPITFPPSPYDAQVFDNDPNPPFEIDISFSQQDIPPTKLQTYFLQGTGTNCSSLVNDSTCFYEQFPGQLGDKDLSLYRGFVVPYNRTVVAHIYGDPTMSVPHPFHVHQTHFQLLSSEIRPGSGQADQGYTLASYSVTEGDMMDVVPVNDGVTTVRWRTAPFYGEILYHCHTQRHADLGMMHTYFTESPSDNETV